MRDMESGGEAIGQGIDPAESTYWAVTMLSSCLFEHFHCRRKLSGRAGRVAGEG